MNLMTMAAAIENPNHIEEMRTGKRTLTGKLVEQPEQKPVISFGLGHDYVAELEAKLTYSRERIDQLEKELAALRSVPAPIVKSEEPVTDSPTGVSPLIGKRVRIFRGKFAGLTGECRWVGWTRYGKLTARVHDGKEMYWPKPEECEVL